MFWYQKAAEQGCQDAQFRLGVMYEWGRGLEQDDEQAVFWYRKAVEGNYAITDAQFRLGLMYEHGRGLEQDDEHAVFWYRKAAEDKYDSDWMYENGRGVEQDDEQAAHCYRKACENKCLDWMYENGLSAEQDDELAVFDYTMLTKLRDKGMDIDLFRFCFFDDEDEWDFKWPLTPGNDYAQEKLTNRGINWNDT